MDYYGALCGFCVSVCVSMLLATRWLYVLDVVHGSDLTVAHLDFLLFRPVCLKTNFSRALSSDLLPAGCLCFLVSHPALHTSAASNSPHARPLIGAPRYQLPGATAPAPPPLRFQTGTPTWSTQLPHDLFPRVINKSLLLPLQPSVSTFGSSLYHPA